MDMQSNSYSTKDLYFAGFLYAKGVKYLGLDKQGSTCWFNFADRNTCLAFEKSYFAKDVDVNAKDYSDALRTLKHLLFVS